LALAVCSTLSGQNLNPKPVKVLGAPRLLATQASPLIADTANPNWIEGSELYNPSGVAIDNSGSAPAIYITDTRNNRILGWRNIQAGAGVAADVILGQANQFQTFTGGPGTSNSQGLNGPTGIAVDAVGNVYVADSNNNRILRYPTPLATAATQTAPILPDLVLGQPGFSTNGANQGGISASTLNLASGSSVPLFIGMAFDSAGTLFVSDVYNNRVLLFPASVLKAQNFGPPSTLVLGQVNNNSTSPAPNFFSTSGMTHPAGLAIDGKGRLYVADSIGRVLVYAPPFVLGSSAARLVGIQTQLPGKPAPPAISNTTVGYPLGVTIAGNRLVVVDAADSRALVFDPYEAWPDPSVAISPAAYEIIGQSGYSDRAPNRGAFVPLPSALNIPIGAAATANELFIADGGNNRVTVYNIDNGLPAAGASRVFGQFFTNTNAPNLIEGREFNLISSTGPVGTVLIDRASTPAHLYVSDPGNNRILCFRDAFHVNAGDYADIIIGQPNGYTSLANYPVGNPAKPLATGLNSPSGLALDTAGNLWVADTGNGRVLRFPPPFAQNPTGMLAADLVIGQASFTAQTTDVTNVNLRSPVSIAFTSDGSLLTSDVAANRVLFFQQPLATGMAATKVIGQTDFFTGSPNGIPADPSRFSGPFGIATDAQDRLYVCDSAAHRVVIFSAPAFLPTTGAQPAFSLSSGFTQPLAITIGPSSAPIPGEVWVSDPGANLLFHFPPFDKLSQSSVPDGGVRVNTPLSTTYDSFGNLVAADGTSRILFYVPLIAIENAANYLSRAIAPGSIISVFPFPANSNIRFGTSTVNFTSLADPIPLPTVLGDVEVLVNQQPVPLFFVSPGQINLPLPLDLSTSGPADIRVVSKSTGRIYGATEAPVTPVSPGLFTLNATGFGQLAALNEDNTVNGPGNPLTRGHVIQIFGTGQGVVMGGPADGMLNTGLAPSVITPQIQISTITVPPENILYSGLAPGLIGVWQINVIVPTTVTAGGSVPVVVSLSSVPSLDPSSNVRTTIALQ
jgi:uncharacterized protein (TIGR03437 family)